jgi:hypothetical protein
MVQAVAFFVVDAVFRGSLILIPVLFAIHLLKFGTTAINKPVLIRAANYMPFRFCHPLVFIAYSANKRMLR